MSLFSNPFISVKCETCTKILHIHRDRFDKKKKLYCKKCKRKNNNG